MPLNGNYSILKQVCIFFKFENVSCWQKSLFRTMSAVAWIRDEPRIWESRCYPSRWKRRPSFSFNRLSMPFWKVRNTKIVCVVFLRASNMVPLSSLHFCICILVMMKGNLKWTIGIFKPCKDCALIMALDTCATLHCIFIITFAYFAYMVYLSGHIIMLVHF